MNRRLANRGLLSSLGMSAMLAVGGTLPVAAQDEAPQRDQPPASSATADPAARDAQRSIRATDSALSRWLIDDHRAEIAISQWAEQALENPQVVEYAKKMIADHQQMMADLEPISRGGRERLRQRGGTARGADDGAPEEVEVVVPGVDVEVEVDRDNVRDAAQRAAEAARRAAARAEERRDDRLERRGDRAADRRERREGADGDEVAEETRAEQRLERRGAMRADRGPTDWLRIKAELSDQGVQSSRKTLERYEGDEQIAAFLGMQLVHHQRMIDTLTVFRKHASPELTRILEQNAEKVQGHLQMAGRLMGEVSRE